MSPVTNTNRRSTPGCVSRRCRRQSAPFPSAEPHVAEHQVEPALAAGGAARPRQDCASVDDVVAVGEHPREQRPDRRLVLDDQGVSAAASCRPARLAAAAGSRDLRRSRRGGGRERQLEAGPLGRWAQVQRATVRPGNPQRDREAEAGSLADLLGREERLEDATAQLRADAGPIVDHLQRVRRARPRWCASRWCPVSRPWRAPR